MVRSRLAGLVFEAWADFDRVTAGISAEDAVAQPDGQSSIAWALGHVTEHVDRWFNATLQGRDRHALLGADRFRIGSEGKADEWEEILAATDEVREAARPYLEQVMERDLEARFELPGSVMRELGPLTLGYALLRTAAHHYFHVGVIACQRDRMGHSAGDYPGLMRECL
jgi:uncharacterized damage-inducible protein DinB